jgi:hypothetical protein
LMKFLQTFLSLSMNLKMIFWLFMNFSKNQQLIIKRSSLNPIFCPIPRLRCMNAPQNAVTTLNLLWNLSSNVLRDAQSQSTRLKGKLHNSNSNLMSIPLFLHLNPNYLIFS